MGATLHCKFQAEKIFEERLVLVLGEKIYIANEYNFQFNSSSTSKQSNIPS